MADHFTCPVCGYPGLEEEPRTVSGGGSYEICPSCRFEYGFTDDSSGYTYESWRARWVSMGMPWDSEGIEPPPQGWNPQQQLDDLLSGASTSPMEEDEEQPQDGFPEDDAEFYERWRAGLIAMWDAQDSGGIEPHRKETPNSSAAT